MDRRRLLITLALGAFALAGCSTGQAPAGCKTDPDCPDGKYCAASGACVSQCKTGKECTSGQCSPRGRCVIADGGGDLARLDLIADRNTTDGRPSDLRPGKDAKPWPDGKPQLDKPPADQSKPDVKPVVDVKPVIDVKPSPDLKGDRKNDRYNVDGTAPSTCAQIIGKTCTSSGGQCGTVGTCLLTSTNDGICTCSCTVDDAATPLVNEDSCPDLSTNICGRIAMASGTKQPFCLRKCQPKLGSSDCSAGIACDPLAGSYAGIWDATVCLLPGCTMDADCPVVTSVVCNTATPTCPTGQACLALASTGTQGRCAKAGKCDLASGLCAAHALGKATAKVGDPCKDDTECAGNMSCQLELDMAALGAKKQGGSCTKGSDCCSGVCSAAGTCTTGLCLVQNRNGYCAIQGCAFAGTLTQRACPSGSLCNFLYDGGLCEKTCTLATASSCRGNASDLFGDYECRAWDNLTIGGTPVATGPVCDFGASMPCDLLQASKIDCTTVGDYSSTSNPTQMGCRTLDNKATVDPYDPTGLCLDTTASGTGFRSPLPTP
jgi:hypothetical protein